MKYYQKKKGDNFKIIVDLVIRDGFTSNRFIILEFINNVVRSSVLNPNKISEAIKERTKKFFQENQYLLLENALSKSVIRAFIKTKWVMF